MKVLFSEDFISDLEEIERLYCDLLFIPESGRKVIAEIIDLCETIGEFPQMGMDMESKFGYGKPYRFVVFRNHILFYETKQDAIMVLRILDGRWTT